MPTNRVLDKQGVATYVACLLEAAQGADRVFEDIEDLRSAYKAVEQVAEDKLLSMLPEDLRPAYEDALRPADPEIEQLVRAADKLSAHIKCIEELKAGNTEFRQAAAQTAAAMDAMRLPELDYFREHFLPSYSLTLDELE